MKLALSGFLDEKLWDPAMPGCQDQIGKDIVPQDCGTSTKGLLCLEKREGETMETVTDFILLGSRTTADGDCSHEIKRSLLLGRKAMTNLDSILKSRDITLQTKVHLVKAVAFPVVMCGCENWTIKKADHQRIDAFEL